MAIWVRFPACLENVEIWRVGYTKGCLAQRQRIALMVGWTGFDSRRNQISRPTDLLFGWRGDVQLEIKLPWPWPAWQDKDFRSASLALSQYYPKATIRSFIAPGNLADHSTLQVMKNYGLDILSTAVTYADCNIGDWYLLGPCVTISADKSKRWGHKVTHQCLPKSNIWATNKSFAKVDDVTIAPAGSSNAVYMWGGAGNAGITVNSTLGVGGCGCRGSVCSIVASAVRNAASSN